MTIIFYEYEYAKSLLENKVDRIYQRDMNFLTKLWDYENCPPSEIYKNLVNYCLKIDPYFNLIQNREKIKIAVNHAKRYKLRFPTPIKIFQSELDLIKTIDNYKYEKIIFCMLICGKYFKEHPARKIIKNFVYNDVIYNNQKIKDIIRIADVQITRKEWNIAKHELTVSCLLTPTVISADKFGLGFKNDDSNCTMLIDDYRNIVGYYQNYCEETMINCESCGVLMIKKGRNHKFCNDCWDEKQKQIKRDWWNKNH